jgi:hypothetical protein
MQALNQESEPKHKESPDAKERCKTPPAKTLIGSSSTRDFLGCFKIFRDVLRCFLETSCKQNKLHSKRATYFTKKKFAGFSTKSQ